MIDFSQVVVGVDGTELKEREDKPLTLRAAAVLALIAQYEDERNLDAKTKFERGVLATRIQRSQRPIALNVGDITIVKTLIGKAFGPAVVVATWPMLDPAEKVDE